MARVDPLRGRDGKFAGSKARGKTPPSAAPTVTPTTGPAPARSPRPVVDRGRPDRPVPDSLVRAATCRRCQGTGNVQARRTHFGVPGLCFKCNGSGWEESDPTRLAQLRREAAEQRRRAEEARQLRSTAYALLQETIPRDSVREPDAVTMHTVWGGISVLEVLEPERVEAALKAIVARHPAVLEGLRDYFIAHAEEANERSRNRHP